MTESESGSKRLGLIGYAAILSLPWQNYRDLPQLLAAALKEIGAVEQQEVCRPLMGLGFKQMAQFRQAQGEGPPQGPLAIIGS